MIVDTILVIPSVLYYVCLPERQSQSKLVTGPTFEESEEHTRACWHGAPGDRGAMEEGK